MKSVHSRRGCCINRILNQIRFARSPALCYEHFLTFFNTSLSGHPGPFCFDTLNNTIITPSFIPQLHDPNRKYETVRMHAVQPRFLLRFIITDSLNFSTTKVLITRCITSCIKVDSFCELITAHLIGSYHFSVFLPAV